MFRIVINTTRVSNTVDNMVSTTARHQATISLVCIFPCTRMLVHVDVVISKGGISLCSEGVDMRMVAVVVVGVSTDGATVGDKFLFGVLDVSARLVAFTVVPL